MHYILLTLRENCSLCPLSGSNIEAGVALGLGRPLADIGLLCLVLSGWGGGRMSEREGRG